MKTSNRELLSDLVSRTARLMAEAECFRALPEETLNRKPAPGSWSVLECLEHLNLYSDFYLPAIENVLREKGDSRGDGQFRSGWLGNYFAESMQPKNGKLKKMKTFADKDPAGSRLPADVLDRFLAQQQRMAGLLKKAETADLSRLKTPVSISRWINLRLGDTFRFVIYHNERHMAQAQRALAAVSDKRELQGR